MADIRHPTTQPKLTTLQIEFLITHIIRRPELFNVAKMRLKANHFPYSNEAIYRALWVAANKISGERGCNFLVEDTERAHTALRLELDAMCTSQPDLLNQDMAFYLFSQPPDGTGLLYRIFAQKNFDVPAALGFLKLFLADREVQSQLQKLLLNAGDDLLIDLPEVLQTVRDKAISLQGIDDDPVESGAPDDWAPKKMNKIPTGIDFIDKMIRGGHAPCETYGVLGAYAAGKTVLAVQLLYESAFWQQREAERLTMSTGIPKYPKECYLFHYEATAEEIRIRLWSSACNIDHSGLEEFDWNKLSTNKNGFDELKDYEKIYYKQQRAACDDDSLMFGELERLKSFMPMLRQNLWTVDMSGVDSNPKRGTGYIPEIRSIIENDLRKKEQKTGRKHEVGIVVIDYAGAVVRRHMVEHRINLDHTRHYIGNMGDSCRRELAVPLQCPVWLFHQLAAASTKKNSQIRAHHSDAAEAKNFAENLVFSFALSPKDEETGTVVFNCSKARRGNIGDPPLLHLEGQFYRFVVSKNYDYDPKTCEIKPKQVMQTASLEKAKEAVKIKSKPPTTYKKAPDYADPTTMNKEFSV
jgi:hypothetical protein